MNMKKWFMAAVLVLAALVSCSKGGNDPRLVIITFDGLRWQELFSGADESLVADTRFVNNPGELKAKYWRETPEERREVLMPFVWSYAPQHGYMLGNRNRNSRMELSNTMNYSYPGYSEMFCGWADDERIHSNDPVPNPNRSVLEAVNADPRYKGKVMMYSSWESIRFAINNDRGGFPGSSGHEPSYTDSETARMMQDVDAGIPENYVESPEQRMDLYRRIALIRSEEDADDMTDELVDRFGDPPRSVNNLIQVALMRGEATEAGITEITQKSGRMLFKVQDFDMELISALYQLPDFRGRLKVEAGTVPCVSLKLQTGDVIAQSVKFIRAWRGTKK